MLNVHDIRDTRVYREAKQEGFHEGAAVAFEFAKLAAAHMSAEQIAKQMNLDLELVRVG